MTRECTKILKGVAIVLVLLGHLNIVPQGGALGVIIFLYLTGYGITASYRDNGFAGYWRKRIYTVYFPYVIWQTMAAAMLLFMNLLDVGSPLQILGSITGVLPGSCIDSQWYITYIMLLYFALYFSLVHIHDNKSCRLTIMVVGIFLGGLAMVNLFPRYSTSWYYFFGIPLGMKSYVEIKERTNRTVMLSVCFLIAYAIMLIADFRYIVSDVASIAIAFLVIQLFLLLVQAVSMNYEFHSKIFSFLGGKSYWIFLCNTFIISIARKMGYVRLSYGISWRKIIILIIILCIGVLLDFLYRTAQNLFGVVISRIKN